MKNWHFSTNISILFENSTRYRNSYNGRQIGTRIIFCALVMLSEICYCTLKIVGSTTTTTYAIC